MAKLQIVLSEKEVNDIIIEVIKKNYNIHQSQELHVTWNDDSGATISTPESIVGNWLETN